MLTFPSARNHVWHPTQGLGELRKSTVFFGGMDSTYGLFSNLPNSQRTLPVHDVIHIPWSHFLWDFYFDISEWHILPASAWTPALMLHFTNPCAEPKGCQPNKPKFKIYKTKSLGHYITRVIHAGFLNSKVPLFFTVFAISADVSYQTESTQEM